METMKILMCKPSYYDIEYEINPWMNRRVKAEHPKAVSQWEKLYSTIKSCGINIALVEPQKGLPDMVFTANAGLIKGNRVLLSDFRCPERQGEKHYFKQWFTQASYEIIDKDPESIDFCFEGEGDALFVNDRLFAGYGIRSDKAYYMNVKQLGAKEIIYCELVDPYFYHLDTCFCPLNETHGMWWPGAFTQNSQHTMQKQLQLFAVPEAEARKFVCNAIIFDNTVIMPAGCPNTESYLQSLGYKVLTCEMSEFIKAGGACKCLVLYLSQRAC